MSRQSVKLNCVNMSVANSYHDCFMDNMFNTFYDNQTVYAFLSAVFGECLPPLKIDCIQRINCDYGKDTIYTKSANILLNHDTLVNICMCQKDPGNVLKLLANHSLNYSPNITFPVKNCVILLASRFTFLDWVFTRGVRSAYNIGKFKFDPQAQSNDSERQHLELLEPQTAFEEYSKLNSMDTLVIFLEYHFSQYPLSCGINQPKGLNDWLYFFKEPPSFYLDSFKKYN